MTDELYRELILDHAKSPRHFGKLDAATHSAEGINPLCGDKLRLYLQVDAQEQIVAAAFEGSGCAISVASASLLTDDVIGRNTSSAKKRFAKVVQRIKEGSGDCDADDKLRALEGVRKYPSRVKCATLAWHALDAALAAQTTPATTE